MYRLLIVDDESIIADGIYELFEQERIPDLEIYRFYSAKEALNYLKRTRIDIVLSDIGMPKIDGFELQRETKRLWPDCKFIFLTSHKEFHYAQTAMRNGSMDFILKTEEDEKITNSVKNALNSLIEEHENKAFMDRARKQLQLALPVLRKDYLVSIHDGTVSEHAVNQAAFEEMQIGMDISGHVLPVTGRIDSWGKYESKADRALMLHALENICSEFFQSLKFQFTAADKSYFALFLQSSEGNQPAAEDAEQQIISFVKGTLESIQTVVRDLLDLNISFAVGKQSVAWQHLHHGFENLRKLLIRVPGSEAIVAEGMQLPGATVSSVNQEHVHKVRSILKQLDEVEYANTHQHEQFVTLIGNLKDCLAVCYSPSLFAEIYFAIASHLISFINRWGIGSLHKESDRGILEQFEINRPYSMVLDDFITVSASLIREKQMEHSKHNHQVIHVLNHYIAENLDKELSLNRLAEIVYLNPAYLSRLYKQVAGIGLVDHINDMRLKRAKQYLLETPTKINEISRSVGFESPTYFARLFKRREGVTPQEFRDRRYE